MGLLLGVFEKEYRAMMGQFLKLLRKLALTLVSAGKNVPYKALGFPSTYDLLLSVPEAVRTNLTYIKFGVGGGI